LPEPLRSAMGVLCIGLAPLSERRDDILPLFHFYLVEMCNREGRMAPMVDRGVEKELLSGDWHGNVAELAWVVSEALRACPGGVLKELPKGFSAGAQSVLLPRPPKDKLGNMLQGITGSAERLFMEEALREAGGDAALAAGALGLSTKNFIHKLREYGIPLDAELKKHR